MNLTELRQEVYTLTNRPDLVAQTLTAIRAATLKLHQSEFFPKDLVETGITFTSPAYIQQLEYTILAPRWRAPKYLRKTDASGTDRGKFLELLAIPELVVDAYGMNRTDVFYVAGQVLQIRSSTPLQYCLLGYYTNPNITADDYQSWIAIEHPYAIVYDAASSVFKMVGDTEQFAAYTALAADQRQLVIQNNVSQVGY